MGVEALYGVLSDDWTEFWTLVTACPPPIGGYGVRLIRLWTHTFIQLHLL